MMLISVHSVFNCVSMMLISFHSLFTWSMMLISFHSVFTWSIDDVDIGPLSV